MHCIVLGCFMLQHLFEHFYMFRSLMGSPSGSHIKVALHFNAFNINFQHTRILHTTNPYILTGWVFYSRSQRPCGVRLRSVAERLLGSWVRIPPGAWFLSLVSVYVLSGRGLCDGPIPRPEEYYWLWCVSECDKVKINNLDTYCE
jgi:hypothetical protein